MPFPTIRPHLLVLLLLPLALLAACETERLPDPVDLDLDLISERDTLYALMAYNSTSYFVYRGEPMGFEHDLIKAFAEAHDLTFRVRVAAHPDSLYPHLLRGRGDIAAARLIPDTTDTAVRFTSTLYESSPVVVQATDAPDLPEPVEDIVEEGRDAVDDRPVLLESDAVAGAPREDIPISARRVRQPEDLADQTVFLPGRSPFSRMLVELSDDITGDIHVVEVDTASAEALIQNVAFEQIDLTVTSDNLARLQEDRFDNIVVHPVLGDPLPRAWAVRPNAVRLLDAIDAWLAEPETQQLVEQLYQRYFVQRQAYRARVESEYLSTETGRLSEYDDLFRRYSEDIGWDWRLLASQAYQESLFQPRARSWAGAEGLLQLMPPTAREFGVTNSMDPDQNVAGAVRFIQWLYDYWDDRIPDEEQRLRFVLASYNTGHGHVEDARRLAAKHGLDDTQWPDVAFWLLQKSNPEVYRDPVVRFGFSRGLEPVTYVEIILERFDHYRQFVIDPEANGAPLAERGPAASGAQG